jgi:hypothetical protein
MKKIFIYFHSKIRKFIYYITTKRIRKTIKREILSFIKKEFKNRNITINNDFVIKIIDDLTKYNLVLRKEMKIIDIEKQNKFKSELVDEINKLINKMYSDKQSKLNEKYEKIINKEKWLSE